MSHGLTNLLGINLFDGAGAVWVFFTISGFLITIALSSKYTGNYRDLLHFYWNRMIRLYPTYWIWLTVTIAAYFLLPSSLFIYQKFSVDGSNQASGFWLDHASIATTKTIITALLANATGFFSDSFMRLGLDPLNGHLIPNPLLDAQIWAMGFMFIGQFWSIGVELCFYALAPWVVRSPIRIAIFFLTSCTGLLEKWWVLLSTHLHMPAVLTMLQVPKYIWMFMLGAMLARTYISYRDSTSKRETILLIVSLLVMYTVLAARGTNLFPIQTFPWWLFLILTASIPLLFSATSKNKIDKFIGELSYPVYINHFLLIQILGTVAVPSGILFASVSCLVAVVMVLLVERPARKLKFS